MSVQLVWFRNDLRLDDNPALHHACINKNDQVIAVYLLCEQQWDNHGVGVNQRALILRALLQLKENLKTLNIPLIVRSIGQFDNAINALSEICQSQGVDELHFNIEYPINERQRDKQVVEQLSSVKSHRYIGDSITAPWKILTQSDSPFKVFTPYSKACYAYLETNPIQCYSTPIKRTADNLKVINTGSDPILSIDTAIEIPDISETSLAKQLDSFLESKLEDYASDRDIPAIQGTSKLSAAMAVGALSVRRCFDVASKYDKAYSKSWLNELLWRDFYRSVIWHFPNVCKGQAFNPVDKQINWNRDEAQFKRWQQGKTGIPIIDAAMRQLNETGWMHNRLRMVVASFLTKNLWIDWREGEAYFAQKLFDFDFASNNGGWQWSASVGTDAAPYFRVFNPASQQQKFDPQADFIRKWVVELQEVDTSDIHKFEKSQIKHYEEPLVDLKFTRKLAIDSFKSAKSAV